MSNPNAGWRLGLSERERKEVQFAEVYATDFAHGTDGDSRLKLVAKMASLLDSVELDRTFPYPATLDVRGFTQWMHEANEAPPILNSGVIVLGRASEKRNEKRYIVTQELGDEVLSVPVPGRFLTPIQSDPPMQVFKS